MNPGKYELTLRNTFEMPKILEKGAREHLHILCVCRKFDGKITFFMVCAKKTKLCAAKRYLEALEFFFFTETK